MRQRKYRSASSPLSKTESRRPMKKTKFQRTPDSFYASHLVSELAETVFNLNRLRDLFVEIGFTHVGKSIDFVAVQLGKTNRQALDCLKQLRDAENAEHQRALERGRDIILALSGRYPER